MREGKYKRLLYKTKIIPAYRAFIQYRENKKQERLGKLDRWYFMFLPIKKKKIVFDSFCGKGYSDNSKAIAKEILSQGLKWDLVWLVNETQDMPSEIRQVKYGSLEAMKELTTAKIWVFNCRCVKHPRKKRKQKYLQTWHGTGITFKAIEGMTDNLSKSYVDAAKNDGRESDYILSYCSGLTFIEKNFFWLANTVQILEYGCPSCDALFDEKELDKIKRRVRSYYNIKEGKNIILYMPTFRDDTTTSGLDMDYSRVIDAFEQNFGADFCFIIRLHPNVASLFELRITDSRIINATKYPEAMDLFSIADFCITDYSSGIFYGLPNVKKCFIYASDYDEYKSTRGFTEYYDNLPIRINKTNDELVEAILNFDEIDYYEKWSNYLESEKFFNDGKASRKVVDLFKKIIS